MEYQKEEDSFVLREDLCIWLTPIALCISLTRITLPAAMVFEETASHKPLSSDTWTDRSALVPKAPAPLWFSHQIAQTHRPPDGKRGLTCPMSERTL